MRFDNAAGDDAEIVYMTDGCLLRECIEDPSLTRYKAVILDEAHIRSLDTVCFHTIVDGNETRLIRAHYN